MRKHFFLTALGPASELLALSTSPPSTPPSVGKILFLLVFPIYTAIENRPPSEGSQFIAGPSVEILPPVPPLVLGHFKMVCWSYAGAMLELLIDAWPGVAEDVSPSDLCPPPRGLLSPAGWRGA